MTITPSEAPHAIRVTAASRASSPIRLEVGTPAVGGAMEDHPLPAIGTTYEAPPPHSVDLYA